VDGSLCFGRLDLADGDVHHIGRIGLREDDTERTPILIDWRADVARPFYLATGHTPMGLRRRRHLTTEGRRVTALHDEILDLGDATRTGYEDPAGDAVLLAALDSARTGRMSDIVQTIQAEQDRVIRAPHQGVMVVEGGPGTGKTAVALHRAAFLLYEQRELLAKRAVLVVGPNPAFLGYIGEVLPSLGETGVLLATVGELFPGVRATASDTPRAARVKGSAAMADVLAAVVRDRQTLPDPVIAIEHDREILMLDDDLVRVARERTREAKLPHNEAREHFEGLNTLTDMVAERIGTDPYDGTNLLDASDITQIRDDLAENPEVWSAIGRLWPRITPRRLVADFLAEPDAYLSAEDADAVRRPVTRAWTVADVPLLDEAAELLGDDDRSARARAERERETRIAFAQGVLEVSYASRTYEFEDKEDSDPDGSEVLSAHDIIDAERFAERHEEDDHRSAAERAAADRTWAFGHIVADGLAAADAALADPLDDPGRRPGPDRGGRGRRLLGRHPRPVRPGPLGAHPPRGQLPHPRRDHGGRRRRRPRRATRLRAAQLRTVHGRTPLGAARGGEGTARRGRQGGGRADPGRGTARRHRAT
jgi:DNA helicase IV